MAQKNKPPFLVERVPDVFRSGSTGELGYLYLSFPEATFHSAHVKTKDATSKLTRIPHTLAERNSFKFVKDPPERYLQATL